MRNILFLKESPKILLDTNYSVSFFFVFVFFFFESLFVLYPRNPITNQNPGSIGAHRATTVPSGKPGVSQRRVGPFFVLIHRLLLLGSPGRSVGGWRGVAVCGCCVLVVRSNIAFFLAQGGAEGCGCWWHPQMGLWPWLCALLALVGVVSKPTIKAGGRGLSKKKKRKVFFVCLSRPRPCVSLGSVPGSLAVGDLFAADPFG